MDTQRLPNGKQETKAVEFFCHYISLLSNTLPVSILSIGFKMVTLVGSRVGGSVFSFVQTNFTYCESNNIS
jgi:hypothetical protein